MKRLTLLAALLTGSIFGQTPAVPPIEVNYILSTDKIVASANTSAAYVDGIMFTAAFSDGRVETKIVHRNRLQKAPSVAMFSFDPAKARPLNIVAATLSSVYTAGLTVQ